MRIEICSTDVTTFEGTAKASGKPFKIRKQVAYLHTGNAYPDRFELTLGKDASGVDMPAYPVGFYTLAPASVGVNPNTRGLEIKTFETRLLRETSAEPPKLATAAAR
ncbi:single-stranded DNA-binding protein [Pseudoxanthomonas winnipegensis]|uniref:single-stranded DNA-binding protein n=1 Tax=Pseudoxanthomonas winnipegensis TaxID=2480810 RepID=UPI00102DE209|nr:single-stranded DNA-binding protein [Pseudoxanthomonas winnipegensis]TAA08847.1 helix-destabilizing protein [Pseudoxanthomonas winnipegensis]TAH71799.1 helix-destabilizing protein [Pseudoxanthomonas winnipegensis]